MVLTHVIGAVTVANIEQMRLLGAFYLIMNEETWKNR